MFMAAGLVADATGRYRVDELGGVARIMPLTALAFAVCGLSLAGIPPGGGFSAKWMLLVAALAQGQWIWAIVILAGGLIAAAYVFMVIGKMLADPPAADAVFKPAGRLPQVIALALGLVAILLGALPMQPLEFLEIGRPALAMAETQ
jgi:multicomponent Na+:H+ antiporter subunit D